MDKNLVANIIAIALMIIISLYQFSPELNKVGFVWIIGIVAIIISVAFLVNLVANFFINLIKQINELEDKNKELLDKNEEINKEINFLKERFKTLEDFAEVKATVKLILRGQTNGKRRSR